jgi:hypothetical protein
MATPTALIDPDGIYTDDTLYLALELRPATLARARREGRLQYAKLGGRHLYFGKWITSWLEAASVEVGSRG